MLDDLKMIHERDAQDALGIAEKQARQYLHDFGFKWTPPRSIYDVVVAGMGGSGLAAKAYKVGSAPQVPFEIIQNYDLPEYVSENTLLICSSYSGNTEETLSVFEEALKKSAHPMVIAVASGGKLLERAQAEKLPYVQLPTGYQPRFTFGYQYRALAEILNATPLQDAQIPLIEAAAKKLDEYIKNWLPTVPTKDNLAKQTAQEMIGKSVVVYAGPKMWPAAYKWKISFNENAKQVAWAGEFPEFNHNEFLGWTKQPPQKPYAVIDLRSPLEHPHVQKRFEVTERLLSGMRPQPVIVTAAGENLLEQLFSTIALGDFVTLYTALLNGLNPTPVEMIEKLKKELAN
ncbi:MAG TPA: bifunctional phosphoglucose/phosphomannose isomerase [Candidatus Saccharimonadales bacterium]|nr:bifunctional phosphoglucose/phosphomannose isomerase [Candidatus Saccharimonadales bacterium]